ncbi:MAG TPA: PAS domain S-box protein, partial [Candidatus Dormibacteraeota bacterium]|nr:PAS domain S-box protein [Candidatus Dormibacteraeota bacterium]
MPEATGRQITSLRPAVLGPDLSEHELLSAVVAQSPVALTVVDPAGVAMLWNPASEGVFGWSAQEVIGHRLPTLDPVSEVEHDEIRTRTLNGAHVLDHETRRRHRDGRLIDVAISTVPLRDPGG